MAAGVKGAAGLCAPLDASGSVPELTYRPSGLKLASQPPPSLGAPVLRRTFTPPSNASSKYSAPPAAADISLPSGLKVRLLKVSAPFASSWTCTEQLTIRALSGRVRQSQRAIKDADNGGAKAACIRAASLVAAWQKSLP